MSLTTHADWGPIELTEADAVDVTDEADMTAKSITFFENLFDAN